MRKEQTRIPSTTPLKVDMVMRAAEEFLGDWLESL